MKMPTLPPSRTHPAFALALCALLAGCLSSDPVDGTGNAPSCKAAALQIAAESADSVSVLKNGVYVDERYGFCLELPASWQATVGEGFKDVDAVDPSASLFVYVNQTPFEAPRTLRQIVEDYWTDGPADSIVIRPTETRNGVELVVLDAWDTKPYFGESPNRDRLRIVHFVRKGQRFSFSLSDSLGTPAYPSALQEIESSLTFF